MNSGETVWSSRMSLHLYGYEADDLSFKPTPINGCACSVEITLTDPKQARVFHKRPCIWSLHNSRCVFPPLETLAVKAVVAESGEDAINRLVHPLQAHGALRQLGQLHHWQTGSLKTRRKADRGKTGDSRQKGMWFSGSNVNRTSSDFMTSALST